MARTTLGTAFSAFGSSSLPTRGAGGLFLRLFVAEMIRHQAELNRQIIEIERKYAREAVSIQKSLVPRGETGALASSITAERKPNWKYPNEPDMYVAGPERPRGAHGNLLEYGTSRFGPQPFVGPAADAVMQPFEEEIADWLEKNLGG